MSAIAHSRIAALGRLCKTATGTSVPDVVACECIGRIRHAIESGVITRAQAVGVCRGYSDSIDPLDRWELLIELVRLTMRKPVVVGHGELWMDDAFIEVVCGPEPRCPNQE